MKLYTEEQVRRIYDLAFINLDQDGCHIIDEDKYFEQKIEELIPIELPSDEEIKEAANEYLTMHEDVSDKLGKYVVSAIHIDGAMWIKNEITKLK